MQWMHEKMQTTAYHSPFLVTWGNKTGCNHQITCMGLSNSLFQSRCHGSHNSFLGCFNLFYPYFLVLVLLVPFHPIITFPVDAYAQTLTALMQAYHHTKMPQHRYHKSKCESNNVLRSCSANYNIQLMVFASESYSLHHCVTQPQTIATWHRE